MNNQVPESTDKLASLRREAAFHDQRIADLESGGGGDRTPQRKYYWATQKYNNRGWARTMDLARGSAVLELGCFRGTGTLATSRVAKTVIGVDISPQSVEYTRGLLSEHGVNNATVQVANAEELPFQDDQFDLVFGTGVIHHVDVRKVCNEVRRVLKPGGHAVFREPLGHNPLIELYRWLTPSARTEDEHPLLREDLALMNRLFDTEESEYFGLTSFLSAPFHKFAIGHSVRSALNVIDDTLLRLDFLKRYAWQINLVMRKPG